MLRFFFPALLMLMLASTGCGISLAEQLKARGVATDASIAFKRESGGGRVRNYAFTLYFFTQDSADSLAIGDIGTFRSVDVDVSSALFDAHDAGERVEIRYLPEDPSQVMLEAQL